VRRSQEEERRGLCPRPAGAAGPRPHHTDWLRHELTVSGPADAVAGLQAAARGAGAIPWRYPDLDAAEDEQVARLLQPPDGSPGLSPTAARILARQLRAAVAAHQQRVLAAAARSLACPFDLHALLPVPPALLRRGPDDPASRAWLQTHWGTPQALRHVRLRPVPPDRRLRRSARIDYEFWSADWTPWAALATLRRRFPRLVLAIRPDYDDA
jgi:hypothetical protein